MPCSNIPDAFISHLHTSSKGFPMAPQDGTLAYVKGSELWATVFTMDHRMNFEFQDFRQTILNLV